MRYYGSLITTAMIISDDNQTVLVTPLKPIVSYKIRNFVGDFARVRGRIQIC